MELLLHMFQFAKIRAPRVNTFFAIRYLLFSICYLLSPICTSAQEASEYQVKAAFICNFAKFVEWPTNTFATPNSPLVIGVFGDDPFDGYLESTAKKIGDISGHPLEVRKITFTADLKNCHI